MTVRETWFTLGFGGATLIYMVALGMILEVMRRRSRRVRLVHRPGPRIIDVLEGP